MTSDDKFDKFARNCTADAKEMRSSIVSLAESIQKLVIQITVSTEKHDQAEKHDQEMKDEIREINKRIREIERVQGKNSHLAGIVTGLGVLFAGGMVTGVVSYILYLIQKAG